MIAWLRETKQSAKDVLAFIDRTHNRRRFIPSCVSAQKSKARGLENGKDCEALRFSRNAGGRGSF
jgi:hypothetical protein